MDYYDPHPTLLLERPLALVGFMASGVGAIARGLTARTGLPLADLTRWVESTAGMSCSQLFLERGPSALAEAEWYAFAQAVADTPAGVIALPHGALLHAEINRRARNETHLIYVERPLDVLFERAVAQLADRPASIPEFMLAPPRSIEDLALYFAEREPEYRKAPTILMARDLHDQEVVETLLQSLRDDREGGGG